MTRASAALALLLAVWALPARAQPALTEAEVRDFVARQERAWNAGDLAAFFATFAEGAVFTDQTRTGEGELVVYGRTPLSEARQNARRALARAKVTDQGQVLAVAIAPGGKGAGVVVRKVSRIAAEGRVRTVCSVSVQGIHRRDGRLTSTGRTDTIVRC